MASLRKRIADNPRINRWVEDRLAGYIRWCFKSSQFDRRGFEEMDACIARGEPVILVIWHQRLVMAGYIFPVHLGPISSLTTSARAGRLAGEVLNRFGFDTVPMSSHKRHVSLSREVLRRIRAGSSIGIAADGPGGPPRICSDVPLMWKRISGCRVFAVAFSANRVIKLPTWDRLMLPMPRSRGVFVCKEWTGTVNRDAEARELERARAELEATINAATDEADAATGRM